MKITKLFFDTEFTGLHQKTTLISIGIISDDHLSFYAEFNDYDKTQVDDWIQENVIDKLMFNNVETCYKQNDNLIACKGDTKFVREKLLQYLSQFEFVKMISDCLSYDWVLFNNIFGTAFDIPKNIYYTPFDICTIFEIKGIDPDINREEYAGIVDVSDKHNAYHDALIIRLCYNNLMDPINYDGR